MDIYWDSRYRSDRDKLLAGVETCWPFARVLELGCNSGPVRVRLRERFGQDWDYVGVDYNEAALALARGYAPPEERSTFLVADIRQPLPFDDQAFDVVVTSSALQCLTPEVFPLVLQEIQRVARACVVLEDYGHGEHSARGYAHDYPDWVIRCHP